MHWPRLARGAGRRFKGLSFAEERQWTGDYTFVQVCGLRQSGVSNKGGRENRRSPMG